MASSEKSSPSWGVVTALRNVLRAGDSWGGLCCVCSQLSWGGGVGSAGSYKIFYDILIYVTSWGSKRYAVSFSQIHSLPKLASVCVPTRTTPLKHQSLGLLTMGMLEYALHRHSPPPHTFSYLLLRISCCET